ncbi:hypothetical protein [Cysteiniphilum sp. 6C5]|uniref:hypothetical protein n=1 Tax=unclassified Cysteiniphilum TaxID=2610889 RepID=UPI003F8267A6
MFNSSSRTLGNNNQSCYQIDRESRCYILFEDSNSRCVNLTEINEICTQHYGDQAHYAEQKLLFGESILVIGKGYLRLEAIEE